MTDPDHPATNAQPDAPPDDQSNVPSDAPLDVPSDVRRRRLLFRSTHRGTFENDLMVGGFVRAHLAGLTDADLDVLESVMELPDTDLADWLTGRVPIPQQEETPMLRRMRDFLAR